MSDQNKLFLLAAFFASVLVLLCVAVVASAGTWWTAVPFTKSPKLEVASPNSSGATFTAIPREPEWLGTGTGTLIIDGPPTLTTPIPCTNCTITENDGWMLNRRKEIWYTFEPKRDITTYELAKILPMIVNAWAWNTTSNAAMGMEIDHEIMRLGTAARHFKRYPTQ